MKIKVSKLRQIIKEEVFEARLRQKIRSVILKEFTTTGRGMSRTKLQKGKKSDAFKSAEKAASDAETTYKTAVDNLKSAQSDYNTAKTSTTAAKKAVDTKTSELETHIEQEPKGADKETDQYSYTNTATGQKVTTANNPGTVGGWESGGKTDYSYTNTATNKKVTTTTDPGIVGGWTVGAAAELKVTSTHFFSADEIKSKVTKVKGPKEMITQIQSDIDKWTKFEKENIRTLPKGFKDVINNMKATLKTIEGEVQKSFEYYSPGAPKAFQAAKEPPQQGKGGAIKGGETTKKFGTSKEHKADSGANKSEFSRASVTKDVTAGTKKFGTSSSHSSDSGANKTSFTPANVSTSKVKTAAWNTWNSEKTTKTNAKNAAQSALSTATSAQSAKLSDYNTKIEFEKKKLTDRDKKTALKKQREKDDIKKQNEPAPPSADEPKTTPTGGGGAGPGKGAGKGKGKGKKGKKGKKGGEDEE